MAHRKEEYVFHHKLYGKPRRCNVTEEDGSKLLMDLYISHKVVSGANKPGLAKWQSAVLNEVKRPSVYEGMDKPYYYDPTTRKLYDNDGDEISFEIITDASVSPCVGKATTPLSSSSSHTTEKSESEKSEQPEEPRLKLVRGIFKSTADYREFYSYSGVAYIGNGQFICRYRRDGRIYIHRFTKTDFTETDFTARFDDESVAKIQKEIDNPTKPNKPPAAAAKPIASPELHAKKNSNFPEFPEQAKEPDVIDLCGNDEEEYSQKPPAPAATGKRPASPLHDPRAVARRRAPQAIDASVSPVHKPVKQSGRDRSTGLSSGREWSLFGSQPTQPDVIQPGDSTSNNDIGQSPAPDEPSKCTTNPNNFGPDPADGSPKHYDLSLDSQQVLSALGRNGQFQVMTRPHLVNEAYSNGTPISSIRVLMQVSTDKPGMPHSLTFGAIRRVIKNGLADFFKHWLTQNCCKELVDAYWALSEHVDSDIEDRSTRSGYYGDEDEDEMSSPLAESFSAQPGILRDNNETGRSPGGSPTTPRCPSDKALDYMLDHAFKAADAGDPRMCEVLNNSAHAAGKKRIYSTCTHKFEFGTPTELPRQEVGDMSSKELQERLDAVENNKALLQRTLHECGRHTERLKKAIRKREQRKKFDHHRKYVKGIHEALEQQHSSRIADMKKCYEKRQQKLAAATNIQAIARSTVNRMQYQKNLPIWKKTQAAMKLANEAEHQAAEAEREARRLRDAADKALSELNKLTNL